MTGKLFTAISLGAQVRREVGRFLSKQLPDLRTLFTRDRSDEDRAENYEEQFKFIPKLDIYLQFRFISILYLTNTELNR